MSHPQKLVQRTCQDQPRYFAVRKNERLKKEEIMKIYWLRENKEIEIVYIYYLREYEMKHWENDRGEIKIASTFLCR